MKFRKKSKYKISLMEFRVINWIKNHEDTFLEHYSAYAKNISDGFDSKSSIDMATNDNNREKVSKMVTDMMLIK